MNSFAPLDFLAKETSCFKSGASYHCSHQDTLSELRQALAMILSLSFSPDKIAIAITPLQAYISWASLLQKDLLYHVGSSVYVALSSIGISLSTPAETNKLSIFVAYIAKRLSSCSSSHLASTLSNPSFALTTSSLRPLAYSIS